MQTEDQWIKNHVELANDDLRTRDIKQDIAQSEELIRQYAVASGNAIDAAVAAGERAIGPQGGRPRLLETEKKLHDEQRRLVLLQRELAAHEKNRPKLIERLREAYPVQLQIHRIAANYNRLAMQRTEHLRQVLMLDTECRKLNGEIAGLNQPDITLPNLIDIGDRSGHRAGNTYVPSFIEQIEKLVADLDNSTPENQQRHADEKEAELHRRAVAFEEVAGPFREKLAKAAVKHVLKAEVAAAKNMLDLCITNFRTCPALR